VLVVELETVLLLVTGTPTPGHPGLQVASATECQ
jgi:hypothetical protein